MSQSQKMRKNSKLKKWIWMAFLSFITTQIIFFVHVFTNNIWMVFITALITFSVVFFMRAAIKKMLGFRAFKSGRNALQRYLMALINATALSFGIILLIVGFLSDGQLITFTTDDFIISGKWLIRYGIVYGIFWVMSFVMTGYFVNL